MSPLTLDDPVTVTTSTMSVSETTITSGRLSISFATCTTDGQTRWSIAARFNPEASVACQRLERAIGLLAEPPTHWSRRSRWEWSCNGSGWTEQHAALIDLADALARFGAEGSGDA